MGSEMMKTWSVRVMKAFGRMGGMLCVLASISMSANMRAADYSVTLEPDTAKRKVVALHGAPASVTLRLTPETPWKIGASSISAQDTFLWSGPSGNTAGSSPQPYVHTYRALNVSSSREYVKISGKLVQDGEGSGTSPSFSVTVPSVDIDWADYASASDEAEEDSRNVVCPVTSNMNERRKILIRRPNQKDDSALIGSSPNMVITLTSGVAGCFRLLKADGKEFNQGTIALNSVSSWPLELYVDALPGKPVSEVGIELQGPTGPGGGRAKDKICGTTAVSVKLKSVDFSGTGNNTLRKQGNDTWANDTFRDDGNVVIDYPEWQDDNLDGTPEKNEPVCYTGGKTPTMTAVLALPAALPSFASAKLRVTKDGTTLVTKDVSLSASEVTVNNLTWETPLPSILGSSGYTLTWSISLDGGGSYTEIGKSVNWFFVVLGTPKTSNSYLEANKLTCKRIFEVLERTKDAAAHTGTIASYIQQWQRELAPGPRTTGVNGSKLWALMDRTETGQCMEGALFMEQAIRLLGIPAEHQHVLPTLNPAWEHVRSAINFVDAVTRSNCDCGVEETLGLYFSSAGYLTGWNEGEGCCLVGGKLYAAFAGNLIGEVGGIVGQRAASTAAHHILLKLENGSGQLQRWRKANGDACSVSNGWQAVP